METQTLNEVIDCLPDDRTLFRYARDDYALKLLSHYAGEGKKISDIKKSSYGRLLEKVNVQQVISKCGQGILTKKDFNYAVVENRQNFVLSVGKWDSDHEYFSQTTRNSGNLVLQVNFSTWHDEIFEQLIGDEEIDFFKYYNHPILKPGERRYFRNTLGWARIDMDFDSGEVLIEEVQNDWLRRANRYLTLMRNYIDSYPDYKNRLGIRSSLKTIEYYVKQVMAPFQRIWDEAILTATIQFCVEELGLKNIYYHTFDSGNRLKKIYWGHPPKSLYSDLPKKFCFELTDETPLFLLQSKVVKRKLKKVKNPRWFKLVM